MNPREKAYKICDDLCWAMGYGNLEKEVKFAALFTVNEIIETVKCVSSNEIELDEYYWLKVKQEIEKL